MKLWCRVVAFVSLAAASAVAVPAASSQTRPSFPTAKAAARSLAESVRSFLFASPAVEGPRFHVLAGPAVRTTARHLASRLVAHGYVEATRDEATILLHLTLESPHDARDPRSLRRVRVTPVVPAGDPIDVAHAALDWFDAPPRHHRVIASLDRHHDADAALSSALVGARHALGNAVAARTPDLARSVRSALRGRSLDEIAAARFVDVDDDGYRRAHLLVSFRPDHLDRIVAEVRNHRAARERRHLGKWLLFGFGIAAVVIGYAWADGRTRGFLRGPLRCAALGGLTILVVGLWVV